MCILENCESGWEIRIHPETQIPYALGCKQCKPHLRHIQLNTKNEDNLELQDAIIRRNNRIKGGDTNAI